MYRAQNWRRWLVLGLCLGGGAMVASAAEFYELRVYRIASAEKAAMLDAALEYDGMQALSEAGMRVGVFKPRDESSHDRYLLFVHSGRYSIGEEIIGPDTAYEAYGAARDYLEADPDDPVFTRQDVSLVKAVPSFPVLRDPEGSGSKERYFELRIYESATEITAARKIEMFEAGGELDLFEKMGLNVVFFGRAVAGDNLPQLTYLLVHEDEEAKDAAWKAFVDSPEWKRMKATPRYENTVSKIHRHFLVALPYSQIR